MKSAILRSSFCWILVSTMLSLVSSSALAQSNAEGDGWISLFNGKDFNGWYTYLESSGKNKDPKAVFKVENGMIHILDVPMSDGRSDNGYLATNQDFADVRIHAEYKWGVKRSSRRQEKQRLALPCRGS